jgi:uncharacterized protein YceH (UPF0502 family)
VRELPIDLVAPGHNAPFSGHAALIDRLLGFYARRQDRIVALLTARGAQTPAELSARVFPLVKRSQQFLTLSEVMGNLEVLEEAGRVVRSTVAGRLRFDPG